MAVPRNRHSHSRSRSKRAHDAKSPILFTICPNCQQSKLPHHLCISCGYYKGKSYKPQEQADAV